jgi:hypothetical protein
MGRPECAVVPLGSYFTGPGGRRSRLQTSSVLPMESFLVTYEDNFGGRFVVRAKRLELDDTEHNLAIDLVEGDVPVLVLPVKNIINIAVDRSSDDAQ